MLKPTWRIPSFRCDKMKGWRSDCVVLLRQKALWCAGRKPASLKASAALRKWMYLQHSATLSVQETPFCWNLSAVTLGSRQVLISSAKKKKKEEVMSLWGHKQSATVLTHWRHLSIWNWCLHIAQSAADLNLKQWECNYCRHTDKDKHALSRCYI